MSYTKPNALTYHAIRIFYKRGTVYFHILSIKRRMNDLLAKVLWQIYLKSLLSVSFFHNYRISYL